MSLDRKRRARGRRFTDAQLSALPQTLLIGLGTLWSLAAHDVLQWRRMPLAIASALIPPCGMTILLIVLSFTVTQEPVALVIQSHGAYTSQMAQLIENDSEAYMLTITNQQEAQRLLRGQNIAAIITIPPNFDQKAITHTAVLQVTLNNIDIDFSDDIRRSVARSVGEFDAPQLGLDTDSQPRVSVVNTPNPYHINIAEHDLRQISVDFLPYQVLPVLVLLVLSTGLMGTALLCALDVERGTARHLVLAPISSWILVAGRLLGGVLVSLAVLTPCVVLGLLTKLIAAPPLDHWPALIALFVATALGASGLGAILGVIMRGTRNIALAASVLATYLFFMGGGFTTIAFLPQWLRTISIFNPIRYAIDGMRQALFYPDLFGIQTDLLVLGITALSAILIGSIVVRRSWGA